MPMNTSGEIYVLIEAKIWRIITLHFPNIERVYNDEIVPFDITMDKKGFYLLSVKVKKQLLPIFS